MPFTSQEVSMHQSGYVPSGIYTQRNATYWYFWRFLFNRLTSVIEIEIPENWDRDYFESVLYPCGYIAVLDSRKYGLICQHGTPGGLNFWHNPDYMIVNNAFFNYGELKIGKQCEVIRLTRDWMGVCDVINYYAEQLAILDGSMRQGLLSSRLTWAISAKDKASAKTIRRMMDLAIAGEPLIVYDSYLTKNSVDKEDNWNFLERKNVKESYLYTEQLQNFRTLLNEFDTLVGVPNVNTEKKERLITAEVDLSNAETETLASTMLKYLTESIDRVKALYPEIKLSARLHKFGQGVSDNGNMENDNTGDVQVSEG